MHIQFAARPLHTPVRFGMAEDENNKEGQSPADIQEQLRYKGLDRCKKGEQSWEAFLEELRNNSGRGQSPSADSLNRPGSEDPRRATPEQVQRTKEVLSRVQLLMPPVSPMSPEKKSDLFEGLVDREFSLDIDARLDETARKLIGESTLSPRNLQTLAAKVALMAGDDFKGTFTVTDELILQAAEELGINLE